MRSVVVRSSCAYERYKICAISAPKFRGFGLIPVVMNQWRNFISDARKQDVVESPPYDSRAKPELRD